MFDGSKIEKKHLAYLLKDKYLYSESEIVKFLSKYDQKDLLDVPENILSDIHLLEKGYPLAYVIGYVDFINTKIELNFKPLIPRTETEYWVEIATKDISPSSKVLDIFSGSGCIGISILKNTLDTKVTLSDIDTNSINQIIHNLEINNINKSRCKVIESDIFENVTHTEFDFIFANPPYIGKNDEFDPIIKFEPENALFTGSKSTKIMNKFLSEAKKFLKKDGVIFMEFGKGQKEEVEKIINSKNYTKWKFNKDQYNEYRWVKIYR